MTSRLLHPGRSLFTAYMMSALIAVLAAWPLAYSAGNLAKDRAATDPAARASAAAGSTAPAQKPAAPNFESADRNRDGFVDKSEAGQVPGLSANFEKADTNKDGKLDQAEFARALERLDVGAR
jgi:EF hand domain-containing protein